MGQLIRCPNIGKVLEKQLNEIGIENVEQLKSIGSRQGWLSIRGIDPSACYNKLCALEGAIQGINKKELSSKTKAELKEFYNCFK